MKYVQFIRTNFFGVDPHFLFCLSQKIRTHLTSCKIERHRHELALGKQKELGNTLREVG